MTSGRNKTYSQTLLPSVPFEFTITLYLVQMARCSHLNVDEVPHPLHGIGINGFLHHGASRHVTGHAGTARSVVDPFDVHQFLVDSERRKRITDGSNFSDVVDRIVGRYTWGDQEGGW